MPRSPSQTLPVPSPRSRSPRPTATAIAVVVSRYSASITDRLLEGALEAHAASEGRGGGPSDVVIIDAPGSFELPALCHAAAATGKFAGVLALGCIIKGETSHDQHLASAVAHGLVNISLQTGVPVSLGVLTVNNARQARDRAGGKHGNKGFEAMNALLFTIDQLSVLKHSAMPTSRSPRSSPSTFADKASPRKRAAGGNR